MQGRITPLLKTPRHLLTQNPRPLIIGHRGAMGHAPENTLASFEEALRLGAEALEMDVRLTGDGYPALFHDERLERTSDGRGFFRDLSWGRLKTLDAGSWFGRRFKGERIPLLSEVLDRFGDRRTKEGRPIRFVVELKPRGTAGQGKELARAAVRELGKRGLEERAFVISFAHDCLSVVPGSFRKGILFSRRLENAVGRARHAGADCLFPRWNLVTARLVAAARGAHLAVFSWTADRPEQFRKLIRHGVEGIATNYPERLRGFLDERRR